MADPTQTTPFDGTIWPIRKWLIFCLNRGWPWWVAELGVETGLVLFGAGFLIIMGVINE